MISRETIVSAIINGCLAYLAAGGLTWVFLDSAGIVESEFARRLAKGRAPTFGEMALASVLMILSWPRFALAFARALRRRGNIWVALKRVVRR